MSKITGEILSAWMTLNGRMYGNALNAPGIGCLAEEDRELYKAITQAMLDEVRPPTNAADTAGEAIKPEIEDSIRDAVERALVETADRCFHEWGRRRFIKVSPITGRNQHGRTCKKCGEIRTFSPY
jgi:hypothetical protein